MKIKTYKKHARTVETTRSVPYLVPGYCPLCQEGSSTSLSPSMNTTLPSWSDYPHVQPCAPEDVWVKEFHRIFPGQAKILQGTPQDPVHHAEGDVWTHTKMVVNEMLAHPLYAQSDELQRKVLWTAACLHDITKPSSTKEVGGRIIAPGHSRTGAVWARRFLWSIQCPIESRELISALIRYHQFPFHAFEPRDQAISPEFLVRKISIDCRLDMLAALAESDIRGRECHDRQKILDNISMFRMLSEDLECADKPYTFPNGITRSRYVLSKGSRDADTPVYDKDMFPVYVLSGPPASGKDTWCTHHAEIPMVSYDSMRAQKSYRHGEHTGEIVHAVHDLAKTYLRKKETFIWNATHMTENMRTPALSLIRQYGGSPVLICLEASHDELLARNASRTNTLKNEKLSDMMSKWERPLLWEADDLRDESMLFLPKKSFTF